VLQHETVSRLRADADAGQPPSTRHQPQRTKEINMACTAIQTELSQLRAERRQQVQVMPFLQGAGLQAAQAELARIDAEIDETEEALDLCLAKEAQEQNPVPQDILATVEKIQCHTAKREVGHEEPYLLIAAFDMLNVVNAGIVGVALPNIEVVKVGPWSGVDADETHGTAILAPIDRPVFWGPAGAARTIANPQDVIFLVALMEHDGSSPDAIRGGVRTNLLAARLSNTNRPYASYVDTMISGMTAAIETVRVAGLDPLHLNEDDLIGGVQQLALTTNDVAALNRLDPVNKTLRFTQRKSNGNAVNDYTVTFSFTV
jgi:hypothetical protein